MIKQDLIPLVERVAELRKVSVDMIQTRNLLNENMRQTPEGKQYELICKDIDKLSEDLMNAETELKSASLAIYKETGEKKLIDKVEVKIYKRLEYDIAKVLTWCRSNAPTFLTVDKKPFEKMALWSSDGLGAPVQVIEEAKCTIGTDLSAYLKQAKEVKTDD